MTEQKYRITKNGSPHMIEHKDLSLHDALTELHHTAHGGLPTVKSAMAQGFRIEKAKHEHEAHHWGKGEGNKDGDVK